MLARSTVEKITKFTLAFDKRSGRRTREGLLDRQLFKPTSMIEVRSILRWSSLSRKKVSCGGARNLACNQLAPWSRSGFEVSHSSWEFHCRADVLRKIFVQVQRLAPPSAPLSLMAALTRLLRGRAEDSWYCVESEPSSAVGPLAVYQRKRVSRRQHPWMPVVDLVSDTALSLLDTKASETLFGLCVDPVLLTHLRFVDDQLCS